MVVIAAHVGRHRAARTEICIQAAVRIVASKLEINVVVSSESGGYDLSAVPAGTYVLKVSKEGFGAYTLQGLQVTINTVTRADVSLKVGALTESVTVS